MAIYNVRYFKRLVISKQSLALGLDTNNLAYQNRKDYTLSSKNWSVISIFLLGLIVILYGVFNLNWHINELSAVFLMIALLCGIASKMSATSISETLLEGVAFATWCVPCWFCHIH